MTSAKIPSIDRRKKWFQSIVTAIFATTRTCGLYPCRWTSFWDSGSHRVWPLYFIISAFSIPAILTSNIVAVRELIESITTFAIFRAHVGKFLFLIETLEPWIFTVNLFIRRKALMRSLRVGCLFLESSSPASNWKPSWGSLLFGPCSTLSVLIFLLCLHDRHYDKRTLSERLSLIWVKWITPIVYEAQYSTMCLLFENSFRFFNEHLLLLEKSQSRDPGLKDLMELSRVHTNLSNGVAFLNNYYSLPLLITVIRVRVTLMVDLYRSLSGYSFDVQVSAVLYCWRFFLLCHRGQQLSNEWDQLMRQINVREICIDLNGMYYLNYNLLLSTTATTLTYLITNMQFGGKA